MTLRMVRAFLVALTGSIACSFLAWPEVVGWRAWAIAAISCGLWSEAYLEAVLPNREPPIVLQPLPPDPQITRNLLQVDAAQWVYEDILAPAELRSLAMGLLTGRAFSEREWAGEIPEFRRVQDDFERRGLVRIRGKRRSLNGRGRLAMLRYLYHGAPIPNIEVK